MSISLLGGSALCIFINVLVPLSKLFNLSVFHFRIPPPYLITDTAQVLTAIILFLPFNFDLNISFNQIFFAKLFLHFFLFHLISFQYPLVCITSLINVFHMLPIWQCNTICSNTFSSLHDKFSTLFYSKLYTNVLTEKIHSLYQAVCLVLTFGKQFQVIH